MILSPFARPGLALVAACFSLLASPLVAAQGGFSATLSAEQQESVGLGSLDADERAALDQLIADDLAYARRENLAQLEGSFLSRHDARARKAAGLDRLATEQLARLDEVVAAAIAARPQPRARPRLKEPEVIMKPRAEIHGSITLAYGWGGGGEFRMGSLWLDYDDPASRVGLGIGLTTFDGDGFCGYYPGDYSVGMRPSFYEMGAGSAHRSFAGGWLGAGRSMVGYPGGGASVGSAPGRSDGRRMGGRGR